MDASDTQAMQITDLERELAEHKEAYRRVMEENRALRERLMELGTLAQTSAMAPRLEAIAKEAMEGAQAGVTVALNDGSAELSNDP